MRLAINRANTLSLRRFSLFPIIFLVSGCAGSGGDSFSARFGTPQMPAATEVAGSISLSGTGAGSTKAASGNVTEASASGAPADGGSIGPQLEALTSEIRSLRGRFEAMEPAINRLVRVEQDMTALISEMELLANDPVPFVAPPELFGFGNQSPLASSRQPAGESAAGQGEASSRNSAQNLAKTSMVERPASERSITLDSQNLPVLSLGLSGAASSAGKGGQENSDTGSEFGAAQPTQSSLALKPPNQPDPSDSPARLAIVESAPRSAPAWQSGQAGQACDAFGIHVGSYLLQESIVFAREDIRERYASILQGLRYAIEDIDLRDGRGLFHRLIAGPVVSYKQATVLCADMEASGNYCKVTFFNPPECTAP